MQPGINQPLNTIQCDGVAGIDWSISHLRRMAQLGGGRFADTNQLNGSELLIEDLITVPGPECGT